MSFVIIVMRAMSYTCIIDVTLEKIIYIWLVLIQKKDHFDLFTKRSPVQSLYTAQRMPYLDSEVTVGCPYDPHHRVVPAKLVVSHIIVVGSDSVSSVIILSSGSPDEMPEKPP